LVSRVVFAVQEFFLKRTGPQLTAISTAHHETINRGMKVWAILQFCKHPTNQPHGQGLHEWLLQHEQTVNAIANVVRILL
jgi:hypothetical protein